MLDESLIGTVLIVAVILGLIWLAIRPRYQFVIDVADSQARLSRGLATAAFVSEVEEVFRDQQVPKGSVRGLRVGKRTILHFSRHVPEPCRQRIRNLLQLHG